MTSFRISSLFERINFRLNDDDAMRVLTVLCPGGCNYCSGVNGTCSCKNGYQPSANRTFCEGEQVAWLETTNSNLLLFATDKNINMFVLLIAWHLISTDVNECLTGTAHCDGGVCDNTVGSYYCLCPPGTLQTDPRTCQGLLKSLKSDGIAA